jgi:CheY-like chemotaxis protein
VSDNQTEFSGLKVMIIDDSKTIRRSAETLLKKSGCDVLTAENGFQATRRLRKDPATQNIPIIIVSSKNQETDRLWGLRQGAKGYLSKPVTEEQLITEINNLLGLSS